MKNPFDIVPSIVIGNNKWSAPVYDERDGGKHEIIQGKTWCEVTGGVMDASNHRTCGSMGKCWKGKGWDEIKEEIFRIIKDVEKDKRRGLGKLFRIQAIRVENYGIQFVLIA